MVRHARLACVEVYTEAGHWMSRWARAGQVASPDSTKHKARQITELSQAIADRAYRIYLVRFARGGIIM